MAKIQKKSSTADPSKPKASFLACFGFSKETKYIGRSDKRRWFCGSGFGVKKSATQTVPIDMSSTASEKSGPKPSKVNYSLESKSKPANDLVVPATDREIEVVPPLLTHPTPHLDSSKEDTCQKRVSFCRKIDSIRTAVAGGGGSSFGEPGSPVEGAVAAAATNRTAAVMTQSASFPTPNPKKQPWFVRSNKGVWGNINETISSKKLDPVIGMSIIMVTLFIMIVWGRLCAILCTSAWFYFLPRLIRTTSAPTTPHHQIMSARYNSQYSNSRNHLNFNSGEYKKKVVLEGFLERNHRNVI